MCAVKGSNSYALAPHTLLRRCAVVSGNSDSEASVRSEDLPAETVPAADMESLPVTSGLPPGLEGYSVGQTLRRCIQQGWLYKRSEGGLFTKCVPVVVPHCTCAWEGATAGRPWPAPWLTCAGHCCPGGRKSFSESSYTRRS